METKKKIIYLAIGLVVIGGIGYGVYRLLTRYKRPKEEK